MKKLPIGISTLEKIRPDFVYIDKTHHLADLVKSGTYYFLSRPRRFGKSLFIDTLKQAFLGEKTVFHGLYLENHWDWGTQYPIIHFDFAVSAPYDDHDNLIDIIWDTLNRHAKQYDIVISNNDYALGFQELIRAIYEKTQSQVVILVDEYDKPILDVIQNEEHAIRLREILKGLYSVIKASDVYLKFVFLTGVSKFSKVGLFSGLNNLNDITLDPQYADICGYTQDDVETVFSDHLSQGKVDKTQLKLWYNGYNFNGSETQKVYNPFDILLFFNKNCEYRNYWFETGNPSFLIKLIQKNKYYFPDMENVTVMEDSLSTFDVGNIPLTTLLFQTGYLTIKQSVTMGAMRGYILGYPNLEVKASLNGRLAELGSNDIEKNATFVKLLACFSSSDLSDLSNIFQSHFASIPNDWYRNNDIAHYEGFYASIVYSYFCALGYIVIAEDTTNVGRIDLTVQLPDKILILEFKLKKMGDAQSALLQIKNKRYADKYKSLDKPIYLMGVSFDPDTKNVGGCMWETL